MIASAAMDNKVSYDVSNAAVKRAGLIGTSEAVRELAEDIQRVATRGDGTVLILGESGTGKNLVARAIHDLSPRSASPFLTVTCTALPEALLESELFGHEKGAFTDARERKRGLFEVADGGTVLLDEIGDMPESTQAKLLRFLESHSFRRLGGAEEVMVNVRVIAATHRDLEARVKQGGFRQDLYYRLQVFPIRVPALRERGEDIPELATNFLESARGRLNGSAIATSFNRESLDVLMAYDWPGNVRELRNVVERAMIMAHGPVIGPEHIKLNAAGGANRTWSASAPRGSWSSASGGGARGNPSRAPGSTGFILPPEGVDIEQLEKDLLLQALERSKDNRTRAGRLLGLSRDQIRYRIEKFGIED